MKSTTTLQTLSGSAPTGAAGDQVVDSRTDSLSGKTASQAEPAVQDEEKLPRGLRIALAVALSVLSWGVVFAVGRWILL